MNALDKYGVPIPSSIKMTEPCPQYRFLFHMEGYETSSILVDSIEINYTNCFGNINPNLNYMNIDVILRDKIDTDTFNDLVKYSRNIDSNKLRIEQTGSDGAVLKTIKATILSLDSISTKFDYSCSDPVKINFTLTCDYDDTVEW